MHAIFSKRILVVFILGFASGLPLALLTSTLQAWFADTGMSLYITGSLSLLGLPYLYRFLWAPVLDKYPLLRSLGRRRSWILATQICLCLGFNIMAWLSPQTSSMHIMVLGFILASLSATQDSVIDAYRVESLSSEEFGLGASLATLGYRIAFLVSGGLALILAQHTGWANMYRIMGMLMLIGVITTLWSDEKISATSENANNGFQETFIEPVRNLIKRRGIIAFCLFVILYKLGEVFTTNISGIVMPFLIQGMGFSLSTIAYVQKIIGLISLILGGLTAGFILLRYSLFQSLLVFGLIQSITNVLFVVLAMVGKNTLLLATAVSCDNFAAGLGSTALVALFMRFVDCRFTATQFSILVALSSLPRVFSGPIGASLQEHFGWVGLYQIAFVLSFAFIPFLFVIAHMECFNTEKDADDEATALSRGV